MERPKSLTGSPEPTIGAPCLDGRLGALSALGRAKQGCAPQAATGDPESGLGRLRAFLNANEAYIGA